MNKRFWTIIVSCLWAVAMTQGQAEGQHPSTYSGEAIELTVVDAETGQPLEGVNIVAHWELDDRYTDESGVPINMGGHKRQFMILEQVTDKQGHCVFPAWGPKPRPAGWILTFFDPELLVFKSGYEYEPLSNQPLSKFNTAPVRRSDWNKKTIKLKKEGSTPGDSLGNLEIRLRFALVEPETCAWKLVPRMLTALDQHVTHLRKEKGIPEDPKRGHGYIRGREESYSPALMQRCQQPLEFLRSHMP